MIAHDGLPNKTFRTDIKRIFKVELTTLWIIFNNKIRVNSFKFPKDQEKRNSKITGCHRYVQLNRKSNDQLGPPSTPCHCAYITDFVSRNSRTPNPFAVLWSRVFPQHKKSEYWVKYLFVMLFFSKFLLSVGGGNQRHMDQINYSHIYW